MACPSDLSLLGAFWLRPLNSKMLYRRTSLYARDRDLKICLLYNEFAYKKTNDDHKIEDRFYKKRIILNRIYANLQIKRPHITRSCIPCFFSMHRVNYFQGQTLTVFLNFVCCVFYRFVGHRQNSKRLLFAKKPLNKFVVQLILLPSL